MERRVCINKSKQKYTNKVLTRQENTDLKKGVKIGLVLLIIGTIGIILSLPSQRESLWPLIGVYIPRYVFTFWTGIIFIILGILCMIASAMSSSLPWLKKRMMLIEMLNSRDRIKIDEVASSLGIKPNELEEIIIKLLDKDVIRGGVN